MSRCRCIVAWCGAGVAVAGDGSAASPRCLLAATLRRYPPVPLGTIPLQSVFHLATAIGMVSLAHSPRPLPSVLFVCMSLSWARRYNTVASAVAGDDVAAASAVPRS